MLFWLFHLIKTCSENEEFSKGEQSCVLCMYVVRLSTHANYKAHIKSEKMSFASILSCPRKIFPLI